METRNRDERVSRTFCLAVTRVSSWPVSTTLKLFSLASLLYRGN